MKTRFFNVIIVVSILLFSVSACEKEKEESEKPMELSEFVLGDEGWSTPVPAFGADVLMIVEFINDGEYLLTLTNGVEESEFPKADYWINNVTNELTLDQPESPIGKKLQILEVDVYIVSWQEENNTTMTWSKTGEEDIIWTRL